MRPGPALFEAQSAAVGPHDLPRQTEPETNAIGGPALGGIATEEMVEQPRLIRLRNAGAAIADTQFGRTIMLLQRHADLTARLVYRTAFGSRLSTACRNSGQSACA